MPNAMIQAPDWLRQTENILEGLNEGVAIVDNQLRVVFANVALLRLGQYERGETQGRTPDAIFPAEDIPSAGSMATISATLVLAKLASMMLPCVAKT